MINYNNMVKERFEKLKIENFPGSEEQFCKETEENKNSDFPVILINEEETIFIEVESN